MSIWHEILTFSDQISVLINRDGSDAKNPHRFWNLHISNRIELKFCNLVKYDNLTSNTNILWPNTSFNRPDWVGTKNHHWFWHLNISNRKLKFWIKFWLQLFITMASSFRRLQRFIFRWSRRLSTLFWFLWSRKLYFFPAKGKINIS